MTEIPEGDKKRKILIVDDEEQFGLMVKKNLERAGNFDVRVETQGSKGLAAAREFSPDLILLDMLMPDLSGPEVARLLWKDPLLKEVPILFLTAVVRKGETETFTEIPGSKEPFHAKPCLAKPVRTAELISAIEKVIAE
ncbi:MAG: response regulator [Candidatus Omnitrophota bacterium]|nr:response regulator [Candidatus Omnitrophota bacterium]